MVTRRQRHSTRDIYSCQLQHFASWCSGQDLDLTQAPLTSVADFFMHLFQSGLQVAIVHNYCSAIAAIHQGFTDSSSIPPTMRSIISSVGCLFNDLRLND